MRIRDCVHEIGGSETASRLTSLARRFPSLLTLTDNPAASVPSLSPGLLDQPTAPLERMPDITESPDLPLVLLPSDASAELRARAAECPDVVIHLDPPDGPWRAALGELARRWPERAVVWIRRADLWMAADALARLLHAAGLCRRILVPLCNSGPALTPAAADVELDANPARLALAVAALSGGHVADIDCEDPPLLAWAPGAAIELPLGLLDSVYVHVPGPVQGLTTPADRRERAPAHPLASLRRQIWQTRNASTVDWTRAVRDSRPVVLHLLHGWGGGAERYVRDLAQSDLARHHLLLRAQGHPGRALHGEALELLAGAGGPVLRHYPLVPGIGALADQHAGYADALAAVIAEYQVEQILVSSLIGHALDALRTGLPLLWIAHDYFPFWPALHRDFGDASAHWDERELQRDLAAMHGPFTETDPAFWHALRARATAAFNQARPQLIAPTAGVLANLSRVAPGLSPASARVLAHGMAPWPQQPAPITPEPAGKLRLVVIGRLNGGKGIELLRRAVPRLAQHAELFLVGAGKAAEALFGCAGVHVQLNYERDQLPEILARIRPHAALMPVTVSETFSYTLSELWSLGIPPIASRLGALAERIEEGVTGLLCAPNPDALVATVAELDRQREPLERIREELLRRTPRTLDHMLVDYASLLPQGRRPALRHALKPVRMVELQLATAHDALTDSELRLHAAMARLGEQEAELARRADWGFDLSRLVDERTRWARDLDAELNRTRQWMNEREIVFQRAVEEADAHRLALEASLTHLKGELQRAMDDEKAMHGMLSARLEGLTRNLAERARQLETLNAEKEHLEQSRAELLAHKETLEAERAALLRVRDELRRERDVIARHREDMLQSTSWRLTAPLRGIGVLIKRLRGSLRFRLARAASLIGRARGSLARRGFVATLKRALLELREQRQPPPTTMEPIPAPVPEEVYETFALPTSDAPTVSVIIPVYNQLHHTWSCLKALADNAPTTPFEVIVVDDGSSDRTAQEVPRIAGVRFHKNPQNLGFIGACNAGAAQARGRYLFFLNNDTAVQPNWLEPLLSTYSEFDQVGLVGSKLIYPDGRLQEAGGIVFNDGSGWNYGRFDHPDDPRYDYPREADYCSGAAILIEKSLFERFLGFDALYKPAYYEDTDLAFKVRAAGLRVIYQPASRVVHFEGITGGTDTSTGTKRFQVINQGKFLTRWKEALALQPVPTDHAGIWRAATHRAQGRILLIDATTPTPDQDSGSVRYINVIKVLRSLGWQCTFFADNRAHVPRYSEALRALGVEVQYSPWMNDPVAFFRQRGGEFDAIMLSRHYVARHYVELAREHAPQALLLFDTVDLHYLREQRAAEVEGSDALERQAQETRSAELDLIQRCDVTLVVSPVEQALLAGEAPGRRVEILSNVHEVAGRRAGFEARRDIWFVGGFQHQPNVDAVLWFVREIWPQVRAELSDVQFHVVGSKLPEEVAALAGNGVVVHGFVADIEPFLDGCRLSVAPLRYGAGVKGKVNQSMAYGQPVVATPIAVEGMEISAGDEALVAADAAGFAAAIIRLYRDPVLWLRLSDAGLANIERHFSFEAARQALLRILRRDQ